MSLPTIEIAPGEPVDSVVERLAVQCRERGIELSAFEDVNTALSTSEFARFFQAHTAGAETIILVMTGEWTPNNLIVLLDVLLKIRADPDPPGCDPRFKIYAATEPPAIVDTLFGDYRISAIECRAAMLVKFETDVRPSDCTQFAAAALNFLASLGTRTSFHDPEALRAVTGFLDREVRSVGFPPQRSPFNLLVCIGCLYGEILRSRLGYASEWAKAKECQPWPCLVLRKPGPATNAVQISAPLGLSPIALVLQLSQGGDLDLLEKSAAALAERCRVQFGPPARVTPEAADARGDARPGDPPDPRKNRLTAPGTYI